MDSIAIGVSGNRTEDIYEADFEDEATGIQVLVVKVLVQVIVGLFTYYFSMIICKQPNSTYVDVCFLIVSKE